MKNLLLPAAFLLSVILSIATISVYGSGLESVSFFSAELPGALLPVVFLPAVALLSALSFGVCFFTDRHRLAGSFVTIAYLLVLLRISSLFMLAGRRSSGMYFQEWMLTRGDETGMSEAHLIALILLACAFFGITVYYFSIVQYRISFLTLVSLMPCVLYAKIIADIDNIYVILIAGANIAVHMARAKFDRRKRNMQRTRPRTVLVHGAFAGVLLLLVALLPKEEDALFYDRFEELFLGGDTTSALSGDYSSLSEFSGNADNYSGEGNRRMYSLYGDTFTYLKRQNYDYYDFENNRWYADEAWNRAETDAAVYQKDAELLRLDVLQNAILTVGEHDPSLFERYGLQKEAATATIREQLHTLRVHAENFGAVYYLSTSRAVGVRTDGLTGDYQVTRAGNFYLAEEQHDKDATYDLLFYDTPSVLSDWLSGGFANFDNRTSSEMLRDLTDALQKNTDAYRILQRFTLQQQDAESYRTLVSENTAQIPSEIRALAAQITRADTYDWQKAMSLEAYFKQNGFTYDLEFRAEDHNPVRFLTESKTGTCSDFATAFVLLARAAGLTVRYTEGYLPEYGSRSDSFIIRERDSHAYPEVFLQNTGWVVFEPTISSASAAAHKESFLEYLQEMRMDFGLAGSIFLAMLAAGILVLLVKVLFPLLAEWVFRLRLLITPASAAMPMAYRRLILLADKKKKKTRMRRADLQLAHGFSVPVCAAYTIREFDAVLKEKGCDITEFLQMLEDASYAPETEKAAKKLSSREVLRAYLRARKRT